MVARDALNRIFSFLSGTALAIAGAAVLLVATNAVKSGTLAPSDWFREQFQKLDALTGTDETIAVVAGAVALAIGLTVALIELVPATRRERELTVRDAGGNTVALAPESVSLVAEQAAREVQGVLNAAMNVREESDAVIVNGNIALMDDSNVAEKTAEITQRVRSALEERMGVKVARLALKMRLTTAEEAAKMRGRRSESYPYRQKPAH